MNILATWTQSLLTVVLIAISALLMLVILVQKGRGGGLSGAFGGGGGGSTAFGTKTGDVFTWITIALASLFVLLAIIGNYAFDQSAVAAPPVAPAQNTPATTPGGVSGTTGEGVPITIGDPPAEELEGGGFEEITDDPVDDGSADPTEDEDPGAGNDAPTPDDSPGGMPTP